MQVLKIILVLILFSLGSCEFKKEKTIEKHLTGDPILDQMTNELIDQPLNSKLYFERAKYLYEKENYEQAIRDMSAAMKIDSLNPAYFHLLSDIYLDDFQSELALQTMHIAAHFHPERIATLLKLSELQLILKQPEQSIRTLNDILAYDRQNAEAYYMLGMNFRELKVNDKAINAFQTATEFDPELIDAWIILGAMHEEQKDKRALNFYNSALSVDSLNILALYSKGFYIQNHGEESEAIKIYNKINKLDPEYKEAYLNKGILYLERKEYQRAYEEFNILTGKHPLYHLGFYYRGIANKYLENIESARIDFQNSLNLKSGFDKAKLALDHLNSEL